jgi:hypothetical protein
VDKQLNKSFLKEAYFEKVCDLEKYLIQIIIYSFVMYSSS